MISKLTRRASLATASMFAISSVAVGVAPAIGSEPSGGHGDHAVLQVSKTADASWTRTHTWTIKKTADPSKIFVKNGKTATVAYTATLSAKAADTFSVSGNINIENKSHRRPVTIKAVSDVVSPNISATVTCPVSLPSKLDPGKTLTCTYKAALPDKTARTNTATVTSDSHHKLTTATATKPVTFPAQPTLVDECVAVKDFLVLRHHLVAKKDLGTVCANELVNGQKTISYSRTFGPFWKRGVFQIKNVAVFVTNDTHTKGFASAKVLVIVKRHHHHDHDWGS